MTSGLEKTKDVNSLMITENKSTVQVFIFIYDLGKKNKCPTPVLSFSQCSPRYI